LKNKPKAYFQILVSQKDTVNKQKTANYLRLPENCLLANCKVALLLAKRKKSMQTQNQLLREQ